MRDGFTKIVSDQQYTRIVPDLLNFTCGRDDFCRHAYGVFNQSVVNCPAEGFFPLEDAIVYEGKHVMTSDMSWLPESTVDFRDSDYLQNQLLRRFAKNGKPDYANDSSGADVILFKAGSGNYGHFLTDIAPKLMHIAASGLESVTLHIPPDGARFTPFIEALMRDAKVRISLRIYGNGETVVLRRAYYFTAVSVHNWRKSPTFLRMRELAVNLAPWGEKGPSKLYVARRPGEMRYLVNASDVEQVFRDKGYEVVYPGEMSIFEQIALFRDAEAVAGGLGAGLTNLAFARPGATITMIDPGLCDYYFWDLSNLLEQRFRWFFAGPVTGYTDSLSHSAFEVDIAKLRSLL